MAEDTAKSSFRSPEEAALRRYYNDILRDVSRPVQLAELLFSEGIIRNETKQKVTFDKEKEHAVRAVLHDVQLALAQSSDRKKLMLSLCLALEKSGVPSSDEEWWKFGTARIKEFITGEYNSLIASVI